MQEHTLFPDVMFFLVCKNGQGMMSPGSPNLGNMMAWKQYSLVSSPSENMTRVQCSLVCSSGKQWDLINLASQTPHFRFLPTVCEAVSFFSHF